MEDDQKPLSPNEKKIDHLCFLIKVSHQSNSYPDMVDYLTRLINFRDSINEDFTLAER